MIKAMPGNPEVMKKFLKLSNEIYLDETELETLRQHVTALTKNVLYNS